MNSSVWYFSFRSYFFDGLSQCGTGACVNVIAGLITADKIPAEQVENVLIALQFIQIPSPSMINAVMVRNQYFVTNLVILCLT